MFSKKPSKLQSRIDSLIGAGTKIEGSITFCGGLRVDGEIVGNITAQAGQASTLFVSDCARIQGEIRVPHLVVNGVIEGPAFVWYFRGFPHVHLWIHVADGPAVPVTSHFG